MKIKSRTTKQASADAAKATHIVEVEIHGGVGTDADVTVFNAVGQFSDWSGYGLGVRDHGFYVEGLEKANKTKERISSALSKASLTFEVTVSEKP